MPAFINSFLACFTAEKRYIPFAEKYFFDRFAEKVKRYVGNDGIAMKYVSLRRAYACLQSLLLSASLTEICTSCWRHSVEYTACGASFEFQAK